MKNSRSWENGSCCKYKQLFFQIFLLLSFSHSLVSNSLPPHELQNASLPYLSPSLRVCPSSCPLHQWCHQRDGYISFWIFTYKMTRLFFIQIFCISIIYYEDFENIYNFSLRTLVISKFWKNKLQVFFSSTVHACSIAQSHLTLCDALDCSPPGSPVHGISQERILE